MSKNPNHYNWTASRALVAKAYQQAETYGSARVAAAPKNVDECPTECDLIPVVYIGNDRETPGNGSMILVGVLILALCCGFVGSLAGVILAGVFP